MKVQIINKSKHALPQYATNCSAGMDLRANLEEPIVLKPLQRCLVPTGLYIALPEGFEAQIRPRSGLALNNVAEYAGYNRCRLSWRDRRDCSKPFYRRFRDRRRGTHCADGDSPL